MKRIAIFAAAAAAALLLAPAASARPPANQAEMEREIERIASRLHPQHGDIALNEASAVLHLGEDYYFLPANEARLVLTEGWGNPPEMSSDVLGMIFPTGRTFADETWGAVITYQATGYVPDDDAESADYNALLEEMRTGEEELNAERRRRGYPATHLVGWAQAPTYDRRTHSVVWARNIAFEGISDNALNYDVRMLGRRGVLSLNMVTAMSKLGDTRTAAARLAAAAEFRSGARYSDYQPDTDATADYGIAGLVAAGAGITIAKKVGIIAVILAFAKKGAVAIFAIFALGFAWFRRRLGVGGGAEEEAIAAEPDYDAAMARFETPAEPNTAPDSSAAGGSEGAPPERSG